MARGQLFFDPELERISRETTYGEFRDLSEAELERRFELLARAGEIDWFLGPDEHLQELTRRDTIRQNQRLERLTWALVALTVGLVGLTVVIAWATLALLQRGG